MAKPPPAKETVVGAGALQAPGYSSQLRAGKTVTAIDAEGDCASEMRRTVKSVIGRGNDASGQ